MKKRKSAGARPVGGVVLGGVLLLACSGAENEDPTWVEQAAGFGNVGEVDLPPSSREVQDGPVGGQPAPPGAGGGSPVPGAGGGGADGGGGDAAVSAAGGRPGEGPPEGAASRMVDLPEAHRAIVINEVTSQDNDDVELLNLGEEAVDLSGWTLIDQPEDENTPWPIPEGTFIEAGAYLVFNNAEHFPFGLGNDDAIYLFNAEGELVDFTDWPDRAARGSWCRIPNGSGEFRTCSERTFGADNLP